MSEWSNMFARGLLFQHFDTIKAHPSSSTFNGNYHHHLILVVAMIWLIIAQFALNNHSLTCIIFNSNQIFKLSLI
jgi:hypothetical protein